MQKRSGGRHGYILKRAIVELVNAIRGDAASGTAPAMASV
jgi:hypothetical protein